MNREKMIEEQKDLKEKLLELVDYMNSEEFFNLSDKEKALLNSQRAGMEMYLNALTNRIYGDKEKMEFSSGVLPLLLLGMFSGGFGSSAPLPPAMPKEAVGKEERHAD